MTSDTKMKNAEENQRLKYLRFVANILLQEEILAGSTIGAVYMLLLNVNFSAW